MYTKFLLFISFMMRLAGSIGLIAVTFSAYHYIQEIWQSNPPLLPAIGGSAFFLAFPIGMFYLNRVMFWKFAKEADQVRRRYLKHDRQEASL